MSAFVRRIPEGDTRERLVCAVCGHVAYDNPKVVVGSVIGHDGKVLLCRRAIPPRIGFWTLPAGFLELGETIEEGARREALEEACANIALDGILAVDALFAAGAETAEVSLFAWHEIPWDSIAFPSVRWALEAWHANKEGALGAPAANPPEDLRGVRQLPAEGPVHP